LQQAAALPPGLALVAAEQTFFMEMTAQVITELPRVAAGSLELPAVADLASSIDRAAVKRYAIDGS
ncbi:MAG: hypothetical protein ACKVQQ_15605, partial [Burkholderiales bacterium]